MKINAVTLSIKKIISFKDKVLTLSFLSILVGIILGVITYSLTISESDNELFNFFVSYNSDFSNKSSIEIFSGIVLSGLPYFLLMFILGGSIFGKLFCLPATAIKAMGIGTLTSYFYCTFGLKGLEYSLLVFFPGKFILVFAMLVMTKNCVEMSNEIINGFKTQKIRLYCIKSTVAIFIFLLSWLTDFLCVTVFSDLFSFN